MKKKTVIAMLMLCMALAATACGEKNSGGTADTENTEQEGAGSSSEEETGDTAEESGDTAEEQDTAAYDSRIVSVEDVSDYVTIGEYKGLSLERNSAAVTDEDVQTEIDYALENNGTTVKDGAVQTGDTVTINYTASSDGKALENGSSQEGYSMVVGDNMLGEEFDSGLIGMQPGETKDLSVTYSADYYDSDVAGKTVDYTVNLKKITRAAELNDDWVAENTDYTTVEEYRAGIRQELEDSAAANADSILYDDAWNAVLENSEVKDYPQDDIDRAKAYYKNLNMTYLTEAGLSMEDFLEAQGIDEEEYEQECLAYAQAKVEQNLIVQGILDAEGLSLADAQTEELKTKLAQQYGVSGIDEIIDLYGEEEVNESLALLYVEQYIVSQATVSEMSGSGDTAAVNEDASMAEDGYTDSGAVQETQENEGVQEEPDTAAEDAAAEE